MQQKKIQDTACNSGRACKQTDPPRLPPFLKVHAHNQNRGIQGGSQSCTHLNFQCINDGWVLLVHAIEISQSIYHWYCINLANVPILHNAPKVWKQEKKNKRLSSPEVGIEPTTTWLRVMRSTIWAIRALHLFLHATRQIHISGETRTRNLPLRRRTRYPLRHRDFFHKYIATSCCLHPGSNRGPSDLQSDALPAEL